jgi:DNA-directed RNA polymerase specialized sigma24 family protein
MSKAGLPDNSDLITSVKQSDRHTLGLFYDKYAPALFGVICRIIPDKECSEEVLYQTFETIWNKIETFDPSNQNLVVWMCGIARTIAVGRCLHKEFTIDGTSAEPFNSVPIESETVTDDKNNKALDLIFNKGYTYDQAAEKLNVSLIALRLIIRTELKYLRESLK